MVRIPRAEVTQEPRIAAQPDLAGSGWGEPGRAMQKLGAGIASLGDALGSLAGGMGGQGGGPEADFQDKLTMLRTDNNINLANIEAQNTYTGNGDDYLEQRSTFYNEETSKALETISPANQPKAQLFFEQRRGPALEPAARFGGQLRQETLINEINETTSTEFGKLTDVGPEEFDARFNTTMQGVDAIIKASPLPLKLQNELSSTAAENALQIFQGIKDPDQAQEILPRAMRLIESADPARQDNLAPQELRDAGPEGTLRDEGAEGQLRLNAPPGTIIGQEQSQGGVIAPNQNQGYRQQGAPGSQSGLGQQGQGQQQGPQFGQINFKDYSAGRVSFRALPARDVRNIILHDVSGDPKTRRLPEPGKIPHYHVTFDDKGVYQEIPFDRQAPHARAYNRNSIGIAYRGFEGDKLTPDAIRNGAAAVKVIAEKFNIPPERILTHPGAGRMATKSGKDPREAAWRTEVLDYIKNGPPAERMLAQTNRGVTDVTGEDVRKPGTIPGPQQLAQGQAQPTGQPRAAAVKALATAYSPQKGGDKMEGGYSSAKPGPDGKAEVRTLADYSAGRSKYVTVAGDPSENGKKYIIPEITYRDASGKEVTEKNVPVVVHDTGSAFKGKGTSAFDIAVDRDLKDADINKQPFSKQHVEFIPEGQEGQGGQDLKGRSLTAQAGLTGQGQGRNVQVADASGRFAPQQVAYRSVQSHLRDKLIEKLPQFKAQALRAEAEREKFEETMRKEEADAAMVEGVTMDAQGQLTLEWIKANEPRLGPDKTTQLLRAYKSGDNVLPLEPERHLELLKQLDTDPEKGLTQATQLFLERRITRSQFDTFKKNVERDLNPETKLPEYAKDWKGEVREQVATHQGDSWDRIERSQKAMQDYSDQMYALHKAGKLTPEIANKRAKEVIDNFKLRKAREDRSSLPLPEPKYSNASRETMTFDELAAAKAKFVAEFQAQAAPLQSNPAAYKALRDDFNKRALVFKRWEDVLAKEAVAKGEKIHPQVPAQSAQPATGTPGDGKPGEGKAEAGKDGKPAEKKPQAIRKRIERDASGNITGLVEEPVADDEGGEAERPLAPDGMMKLGGPKDGEATPETEQPSFGQVAMELVKRGVVKDVGTAEGILAPFKRLFAGGGWQKGPDDPQSAEDMRNVLLTTGLGATGLGTRPKGSLGAFGRREDLAGVAAEKAPIQVPRNPNDWGGEYKLAQAHGMKSKGASLEDIWHDTGWTPQPKSKSDPHWNQEAFEKYGVQPGQWYMEYGTSEKALGDRYALGVGQRRLTPPWKTAEPEKAFDADTVYDPAEAAARLESSPVSSKQIAAKEADKVAAAGADKTAEALVAMEDKMRKSGASSQEIAAALSKQGEEVTAEALDKGEVWWRVTDKEKLGPGKWERPTGEALKRPDVQDIIKEQFAAGKPHEAIAKEVEKATGTPVSYKAISRWTAEQGLQRDAIPTGRSNWSDEALATLAKAKEMGLTSEQTAQLLNKEFPAFEGKLTAGTVRKRLFKTNKE
jgi:hypothetical protein